LISHHLKILKEFGLISSKQEGVKIFYKMNQKIVSKYLKILIRFLNSKEK